MTRLLVFPADPLHAYRAKGEVKDHYFNPQGMFDEVHVASTDEEPIDQTTLRTLAGTTNARHHVLGHWRVLSRSRSPYTGPYLRRATALARDLQPDVVRAYTPVEVGWLARASARAAGAPYIVSVHGNYDLDIRTRLREQRLWRGYLYYSLTRLLIEPAVLRDAAYVICAYEFAARYARTLRQGDVEVVYNRVDLSRFRPVPRDGPFTVLFVGRCEDNKGQDVLLRAMAGVPGNLVLVGDGPTRPRIAALARELRIEDRVQIIPRVPHADMPGLYAQATCFASAIVYGGIQIPHLEAMASGLPLVVAQPTWEREPEQMADVALVPLRRPEAIADALRRVAGDRMLADDLSRRSIARARDLAGERMEERERVIYEQVMRRASRVA